MVAVAASVMTVVSVVAEVIAAAAGAASTEDGLPVCISAAGVAPWAAAAAAVLPGGNGLTVNEDIGLLALARR